MNVDANITHDDASLIRGDLDNTVSPRLRLPQSLHTGENSRVLDQTMESIHSERSNQELDSRINESDKSAGKIVKHIHCYERLDGII